MELASHLQSDQITKGSRYLLFEFNFHRIATRLCMFFFYSISSDALTLNQIIKPQDKEETTKVVIHRFIYYEMENYT